MSEVPAVYEAKPIVNLEDYAMSLDKLLNQVQLIQQVMGKVMKEGEHWGKIPGTDKPTLLKPGAEKLCLVFRLEPDYEIIREVREMTFLAYTIRCRLSHIPTGQQIASGIGSCNSREAKYRYRTQNTGKPVPSEYWKARDPNVLGGAQYRPRKHDGKWVIYEQVENENPWDLDNTIIKMACKRALVAATLNATAASDIFTQDVEDMPEFQQPTNGKATEVVVEPTKEGMNQDQFLATITEKKQAKNGQATVMRQLMRLGFKAPEDVPADQYHVVLNAIDRDFAGK